MLSKISLPPDANVIIYGEIHSNPDSVTGIQRMIKIRKPDYILHELLYDDICLTEASIIHRLANCKEGGKQCDPRLNRDVYKLGKTLKAKLVGIDLPTIDKSLTLAQQFEIREKHMCKMIAKYINEKVVVVVGDTHLRTTTTKELGGPSLIQIKFSDNQKVLIIRAAQGIRELE